ncbi:ras GEF [Aureobasidium sp. EXF-12298]|nr:ras GEF [Aureobasidium sp. EXF-12298]
MDTGHPLHVEASCNVASASTINDTNDSTNTPLPLSPPREPPSILRRKVRKKSIRNTKDSAEMARLRYHREKNDHQQAQSQSLSRLHHATKAVVDRQFSVANVGQNGTMYLRFEQTPMDTAQDHKLMLPRPNARPIPRAFRPPPTPPDTSDAQQPTPSAFYWHDGLHQSAAQLSLRQPEHDFIAPRRRSSFDSGYSRKSRHETDTATHLRSPSLDSPRPDPQQHLESKNPPCDAVDSLFAPLLEVPIPNFRLGSPRFSDRGTAFLHNSYHTAFSSTTDLRPISTDRLDRLMPPPAQRHQNSIDLRRSPSVSWFSPSVSPAIESARPQLLPSPLATPPLELDRDEIPYTIYDKVAADPDNNQFVRYADGTAEIVAATPTRLIVEVTSVKFLDYDLLSDFFLTYRAFLSPSDLARYLVARLRWAVSQTDESGRVVRVRTFVALRHWILNYFTQDFELDHELRNLFCNLVNKLALHVAQRPQGGAGGDLQVLTELQKCWNRTCALVWRPTIAPQSYMPLRPDGDDNLTLPGTIRMRSLTNESHMRNSSYMGNNISTVALRRPDTGSRLSEASIQVTSCSFPRLKRSKHDLKSRPDKPGHGSPPRSKGFHRHKRSDSFSDALRDSRVDRPKSSEPSAEVQVRPGRIIRGLVIHPGSAKVIGPGPPSPPFLLRPEDTRPSLSETLSRVSDIPAQHARLNIFGSVRRALSTRNGGKSPFHHRPKTVGSGDLRKIGSIEPQPRDMIRQIQARKAQNVHTDALAAMVMRTWQQQGNETTHELTEFGPSTLPVARNRSKTIETNLPVRPGALRLLSNVTTSSRSIMIIDGTGLDESARTPDLVHTIAGFTPLASEHDLSRQTTREHNQAAVHDVALNNTAFLLPYNTLNHFDQPVWTSPTKSATLSTAPTTLSIMSSPHSPPPTVPLPPLPVVSASSTERAAAVADCKPSPDTEITTSFGTGQLYSANVSINRSPALSFRKSSLVDPAELPGPARQLRRKPGGNLRGVDTVHDLGVSRRRQSTGSITSPVSIYGSPILTITSGDGDETHIESRLSRLPLRAQASDGDIYDAAGRGSLRLLSTHSSLRHLRPSMEVEVARLREMPPVEDDGGVESALLKLEGRYVPSRSSDKTIKSFNYGHEDKDFPNLTRQQGTGQSGGTSNEADMSSVEPTRPGAEVTRVVHRRHGAVDAAATNQPTQSTPAAILIHESSIATRDFAVSDPPRNFEQPLTPDRDEFERADSPTTPASTFLLDDGESLVDRNSMCTRQQESKPSVDTFLFDAEDEDAVVGSIDHYQPSAIHQPLTPPTTADNISDHGFDQFNAHMLLPGPPTVKPQKSFRLSELLLSDQFAKRPDHSALPRTRNLPTQHTPFILAHSSEALAMQFTIIEKDALDSVDWKDLINLGWSQEVSSVRDWAQYIHAFPTNVTEVSSIDLIITRFNLVIKWCISSVLLCGTSEERAQCITKFVHVATHSHRSLRNFATTAQITIALLSSDLSRLSTTWAKVAQAEKDALRSLENLVSPMRNFAVLRAEMESAAAELSDDDVTAGKGVIPFLGVYTRDLALNAQKPAFITPAGRVSTDGSHEKLVNFERHRTTASIVKGVLRLLDASSRYAIKADAEILAKCLWLAALADNEIAELSKGLEK